MSKEHILQEIKRTARENGGIPLGRLRFFRETGIKESDWKGKFWARWNDAVSEAGLEPNQKTTSYDEDLLIEKFISLMRELGRFPVVAEIRMKVRSDASFPNDKTFGRFGSKPQFAATILVGSYIVKDADLWHATIEFSGPEDAAACAAEIQEMAGPARHFAVVTKPYVN